MRLWMYWIYPFAKKTALNPGGVRAVAGDRSRIRERPFARIMVYGAELNVLLSRRRRIVLGPDQGSRQGQRLPRLPSWASSTSLHSGDNGTAWPAGSRRSARPWQSPQRASQRLSILLGCRHRAFAREAERMWSSLADMLPYSKDIYQNALITHGRWREWIDYQLSTGREPLELRVSELAPIEKNAPSPPFTIRPSSGTSFIRTEL